MASNTVNTSLCASCAVCTMLIPLLPVEGTGVITPACGRVIRTGGSETLAHKSGGLCPQTHLSHEAVSIHKDRHPPGPLRRAPSLHVNHTVVQRGRDEGQHFCTLQTGRAVLRHTQTHQKGIWLLTATGQLWSVANINDISASANANPLPSHGEKKKWQKHGKHNVGDTTLCNSGNMLYVEACTRKCFPNVTRSLNSATLNTLCTPFSPTVRKDRCT